jgi:hypothetical protein
MHGMQGTFPQCKKHLPSDNEMRCLVIDAMLLVHNFQTNYIGYSQIKTVFEPEYECVANLKGYDRTAQ